MSGDPQECRRQAAECFRFAQAATSPKSRDDFTKLANVWLKLADQFEADRALLYTWGGGSNSNASPPKSSSRRVA
jgi:hypothetical protein